MNRNNGLKHKRQSAFGAQAIKISNVTKEKNNLRGFSEAVNPGKNSINTNWKWQNAISPSFMDIIFSFLLCLALFYVFYHTFFSSSRSFKTTVRRRVSRLPKESEGTFIVCAFSMLGKLAQTDGVLSEDEVRRVDEYIRSSLKLDAKTRELALSVFREAGNSPLEIRDYAERFDKSFSDKVHLANELVTILLEVGASDGVLGLEEERSIRSVALLIGLSDPGFERLKKAVVGEAPLVH